MTTRSKVISIEGYKNDLRRNEEATVNLKKATNMLDNLLGAR